MLKLSKIKASLKLILKYINYKLTSFTEHDIHSPFLYNFYEELIKNPHPFGDFEELNLIRNSLLKNNTTIDVTDFGVGSKKNKSKKRSIKDIAKHGIAQKKQSEFLYRLINKFKPKTIIELGTSIGLTSLYLSKPSKNFTVYSIEGCLNLQSFAKQLFLENKAFNIVSMNGNFDIEFPNLLAQLKTVDFVYIDGNHSYESTITYFNEALKKKHDQSIFVIDDINWSEGMQKAWKEIYSNLQVTLSLDFFYFGIVFFRTEQKQKEHYVLNF